MAESLTELKLVSEIAVLSGPNSQQLGLIPIYRNESRNAET